MEPVRSRVKRPPVHLDDELEDFEDDVADADKPVHIPDINVGCPACDLSISQEAGDEPFRG